MHTITSPAEAPTTVRTSGRRPTVFHYHRKDDITRSIVTGESIKALCGHIGKVSDGNPEGHRGGSAVVCQACSDIYDSFSAGGEL